MAAYIPPHKRHLHLKEGKNITNNSSASAATLSPTPIPQSLFPRFKNVLNFQIFYGPDAISRWFLVGFADEDDNTQFVNLIRFETDSSMYHSQKIGEHNFIFVPDHDRLKEHGEEGRRVFSENPWKSVTFNVKHDLILAFERVKGELKDYIDDKHIVAKPGLYARFGRVVFRGKMPSEESSRRSICPENRVKKLKRAFRTSVSASYMDYILSEAVPKLGLEFEVEKEFFVVKVSDSTRPKSHLSCKCKWSKNSQQLELFKIDLCPVRHLVVDVSCLERKTDLRLMLCTKRAIMNISDDEMKFIKKLISSAIVDPEVKGGLKWPLGKESSGDRYTVVGASHVIMAKTFRSLPIRLKVVHIDRFDLSSSSGEISREIDVKMPQIVSEMEGRTIDEERLGEMLENNLKVIWDACLSYEADAVFE